MSEWKKVKLGDCISTRKGFAFKSSQYVSNGIPVVRVSDFTLDSISEKDLVYYPISEYDKYCDYVLNEKDILIQTVGSWQYNPNSVVGKVVKVPFYHQGSLLNQNIVKVIPNNNIYKDFIYYRLKCFDFSGFVVGEARGAANQASITLDTIKRFSFLLPPYGTQHRIATILSRYDSLIENYQKQIKLLEEAAQRLYKEWVVDLRFPGHENTKIVDGVPEGWEKKKVGDITPIITGKKDANFGTDNGSFPFFTCAQEPIKAPSYSFDTSAVILAGNGDFNVKLFRGKFEAYQRTYVLEPNNESLLYLLYFCISENMNRLATGASGSTIKFLTKGMIESLDISEPSISVIDSFNRILEPIRTQKEKLQSQIHLLTEARDRLLPKLMTDGICDIFV